MEMLNGDTFANMLRSGAAMLGEKREEVNDLNVFPDYRFRKYRSYVV